jgi:hypothetical protein
MIKNIENAVINRFGFEHPLTILVFNLTRIFH